MKIILLSFLIMILSTTFSFGQVSSLVNFTVGYEYYTPKLTGIHKKIKDAGYGTLEGDSGIYLALHIQEKEKGAMIGYNQYKANSENFNISISNIIIDYSYCFATPSERLAMYFGLGTNVFYMERHGIPDLWMSDAEYADWLWGLNGLLGISFRVVGPLYVGYEIGYTWSKQSTLGGTMYDLSGKTQTFIINLIAFI